MKWAVRIVLLFVIAAAAVFVWGYSVYIPYGFKTSPMAWIDQWRSSRAWEAIDYSGDPDQTPDGMEIWMQMPAALRDMARQQLGGRERWADRKWGDEVFFAEDVGGPEISLIFPYPLGRAFEPTRDIDTREVFGPLLECVPQAWEIGPATAFDLEAWTEAGTPPAELLARAEAGDLDAQYDLGLGASYLDDGTLATELAPWLERAADAGHVRAMEVLGAVLISDPTPNEPPSEQGLAYLEAAIAQGSTTAMAVAAYAQPRPGEDPYVFAERRLDWEIQAAAACNADSLLQIGWRLVMGRGLPRDHDLGMDIAVLAQNNPEFLDRIDGVRLTDA